VVAEAAGDCGRIAVLEEHWPDEEKNVCECDDRWNPKDAPWTRDVARLIIDEIAKYGRAL